jgi:hypothetical protein
VNEIRPLYFGLAHSRPKWLLFKKVFPSIKLGKSRLTKQLYIYVYLSESLDNARIMTSYSAQAGWFLQSD